MNIYFLVEGRGTEIKVYPEWLLHLVPELHKVQWHYQVVKNNYCMLTGNGFPSLLYTQLKNTIEDINSSNCFDYFVICLDGDDDGIDIRKQRVLDFMAEKKIVLNASTKFEIIVQNKCIETWFLANPKIFKKNPSSDFLRKCIEFYNVKKDDPELMGKLSIDKDDKGSTSIFHSEYFKELLLEKAKVHYSKNNPKEVVKKHFLEQLIERSQKTKHISSFQNFVEFCQKIRTQITK